MPSVWSSECLCRESQWGSMDDVGDPAGEATLLISAPWTTWHILGGCVSQGWCTVLGMTHSPLHKVTQTLAFPLSEPINIYVKFLFLAPVFLHTLLAQFVCSEHKPIPPHNLWRLFRATQWKWCAQELGLGQLASQVAPREHLASVLRKSWFFCLI